MARKNSKLPTKNHLRHRIQREITTTPVDSLDPDLQTYLNSFLNEFLRNKPLPYFNLLTPESAAQALASVERMHKRLTSQQRTALALKRLIEQKQG